MKKIKPLAVVSSIIIVIGIVFIARFNSIFSLPEGEIMIYDEPYAPAADVSKLAVADDMIAVFYEDAGYAGFYSLDGAFLFGVRVDSASSGSGNIGYVDGHWVIYSKNNNFYIFDGKNLIDEFHVSINENSERGTLLLEKMGGRTLKCEYLGEIYSVEASSKIVRNGTGGEMLIAELSQNKTAQVFFWTVFAVCIIGAALTIIKERKNVENF